MSAVVLGLDIGGANLKAATSDGKTALVPFPLWKRHLELPHALAELVAQFPDTTELAITMTGELCDCYETKREGVEHIITSVMNVSRSRPIRIWSTHGTFLNTTEAQQRYQEVAAANWHALTTVAGGYVPTGAAVLVDVGSTTTDVIPLHNGVPVPVGRTDVERMKNNELVYTGVRRTPLCALMGWSGAAELFASTLDLYLLLGNIPEDHSDCDTADNRPATKANAHARISRMLGGDSEMVSHDETLQLAMELAEKQQRRIAAAISERSSTSTLDKQHGHPLIVSGSGEFLARAAINRLPNPDRYTCLSLTERLGPQLSEVAPAYAVAKLAAEQPPA
jgi:(4-(4-[2-(gamma-L-glutamylamino)ethyl]phenoxymethyl)furan-2-yl)methanamine synthase